MKLDELYQIYRIRSGQPRPYADHEYVYWVQYSRYHPVTEEPLPYRDEYKKYDDDKLIELAKLLLGVTDLLEHNDPQRHFSESYFDYAKLVSPNTVEVRYCTPYVD